MITINKYRVNSLIPDAVKIIKDKKFYNNEEKDNKEKPKEYNGYISAFNANCIMMTALAAAIMYNSSKSSSEDKSIITKWIFEVLKKEKPDFTTKISLVDYIEENTVNGKIKTPALINILTAGNALKLAIRKFKLI
jgi:hypothetical protein